LLFVPGISDFLPKTLSSPRYRRTTLKIRQKAQLLATVCQNNQYENLGKVDKTKSYTVPPAFCLLCAADHNRLSVSVFQISLNFTKQSSMAWINVNICMNGKVQIL
jgi:hypothetical protein